VALRKGIAQLFEGKIKIEQLNFQQGQITTLLKKKNVDEATHEGFVGLLKNL